jgi:hypothetical protein
VTVTIFLTKDIPMKTFLKVVAAVAIACSGIAAHASADLDPNDIDLLSNLQSPRIAQQSQAHALCSVLFRIHRKDAAAEAAEGALYALENIVTRADKQEAERFLQKHQTSFMDVAATEKGTGDLHSKNLAICSKWFEVR